MRNDSKSPSARVAVTRLKKADPVLARVIESVGPCRLAVRPAQDPFEALAECIVYQQLSGKAAATIFGRLKALFHGARFPSARRVLETPVETLRSAGLSGGKTKALLDLAAKTAARALPLSKLHEMEDEAVVQTLSSIHGIGRWSAEMYLIFRLGRPDVLPIGDLGLQKGVQRAYALPSLPKPADLARMGEAWRPYRSVATWYFWASLE